MLSPRQQRLESDYQKVRERFDADPNISVQATGPYPFEKYQVTYELASLRLDAKSRPILAHRTTIDFELPMRYPTEKPRAVSRDTVFHPNFGSWVCIADFWSPAQSLADIFIEVGEMLQWQRFNIQSPLNAAAADWAVKNASELPVGNVDLHSNAKLPEINIKN
jgi:ubiquitin-protein ligase